MHNEGLSFKETARQFDISYDTVVAKWERIYLEEGKEGEDKAAPSFKKYIADHKPEHAFRFSKRGYRKDGDFTNLPLYLARKTKDLL